MATRGDLQRLRARLAELRAQGARAPLTAEGHDALARLARHLLDVVTAARRVEARLADSRGLALEDARGLLAEAVRLEREAAVEVVVQLRRAGRIRSAARAYLALIQRAARDHQFHDLLAGFGHLLEEHGQPAAGAVRALAASLPPDLATDANARELTDEALAALRVDWPKLPERG
ncbi:MAG: hypothetical protein KBG48_28690 [Kofleriaceae bacterium]|nr:hypothetical protein [Kofleriaceae bacterium]MBP9171410.1 hypothetical protein [Kofleriaceae bacterium]MBP9863134.1 hypothetical protein [Kofleriaceae bacterium]